MPRKTRSGSAGKGEGRLIPPAGGVIVRMYNPGFGDCFLLAFRGDDDEPRYMLIDCGVHDLYYKGKEERMKAIAQDILDTCGKTIHLLAVTHEHTDHISGFMQAQEIFSTLTIEELWLAWPEDKTDPVAIELEKKYGKKKAALQAAITKLADAGNPRAGQLRNIFRFEQGVTESGTIKSPEAILDTLRSWSRKSPERPEDYCIPGNVPRNIPGVSGIRCYVMGPPHSGPAIRKEVAESEMYFSGHLVNAEQAFIAAVTGMSGTEEAGGEHELRGYPFDSVFSVPPKEAESASDGFFRENYGFSEGADHGPAWRRIETDWLEGATIDLALKIGGYVNNTSLVLAFELTPSGKVLLFAGDAQAGNWLSWSPDPKEKDPEILANHVDGERLLKETVFYKVGHHGSRNATLKQKRLDLMNRDLVAMIPVDEKWAHDVVHWNHPDPKLLPELKQHARGRVLRSDQIPDGNSMEMPPESLENEWNEFQKKVKWDRSPARLWIQYTVS
jgi:hypothetical protein